MIQPFRVTVDQVIALSRLMDEIGLSVEAARMQKLADKMIRQLTLKLRAELSAGKRGGQGLGMK